MGYTMNRSTMTYSNSTEKYGSTKKTALEESS
jgi:hypothetical protein